MNKPQKFFVAAVLLLALSLAAVFSQRSSAQTSSDTGHGFDRANLDPNAAACTSGGQASVTGLVVPGGLGETVIVEFGPAHGATVAYGICPSTAVCGVCGVPTKT